MSPSQRGGGANRFDTLNRYELKHLAAHLQEAGLADKLHQVLRVETRQRRNAWYEAKARRADFDGYVEDVGRAWSLADQRFRGDWPAVGLQCRYALVTASLNSLAGNIPSVLLEALVRHGLWAVEQALAHALQKPNAAEKVKALGAIVPHLSPALRDVVLAEALTATRAIEYEEHRVRALAALVPQLPVELQAAALAAVLAIENEGDRSDALAALAPHLPAPLLSEALNAAGDIEAPEPR
jgi:hypothetical protein